MTVTLRCTGSADSSIMPPVKYWEIVADKLSVGPGVGLLQCVARDGWRWIVDVHREGRRYIVHSEDLLSAFCSVFHPKCRILLDNRVAIVPRGRLKSTLDRAGTFLLPGAL
jgi:hypothetical protein